MIDTPTPFRANFALVTKLLKSTIATANQNFSLASEEAMSYNFQLPACKERTRLNTWEPNTKFTARCANYHLSEKAGHAKICIMHNTIINTKGIKQSDETLGKFFLWVIPTCRRNLQISMQIDN